MRLQQESMMWRRVVFALVLMVFAKCMQGQAALHGNARNSDPAGTLTVVRSIRTLSQADAARSLPVHLKAVVSYYDASIDAQIGTLFVHDATGGIFLLVPARPLLPIRRGTVLDVVGVTAPGGFAPVVAHPQLRVLGQSDAAEPAPLVSLSQMADGSYDSQIVEVEGVVHSATRQNENSVLKIAIEGGLIHATTLWESGVDYGRLVGATVRAHAVAASRFNEHRQLSGVHLFIASAKDIQVLRSGPAEPFELPLQSISQLSAFDAARATVDRVHIRGTVTLLRPGQLLCVQDQTGGICVDTEDRSAVPLGAVVDVVGFRARGDAAPKLTEAVIRDTGRLPQPLMPRMLSSSEALTGIHAGELVQMEGEVAGLNSDPREPSVMIASRGLIFSATLPSGPAGMDLARWKKGSKVRIAGICSMLTNSGQIDFRQGKESFQGFRILLRSPDDITTLKRPSWWTPVHTIATLSAALLSTLAALGWAMMLHRRVEQQTRLVRDSEERFRHLAHHDPLTGLPNRALLQLRLSEAIEKTRKERYSLALFMLDLDGFKQVNDSLGHDAGDLVLQAASQRICDAVEKGDTVARIGGDEFVVLLLRPQGVDDAHQIAKDILRRFTMPLQIRAETITVSCSIGISICHGTAMDAQALMSSADAAMYQAKLYGRNQFQTHRSLDRQISVEISRQPVLIGGRAGRASQ